MLLYFVIWIENLVSKLRCFILVDQLCVVLGGIRAGFSQSMVNIGVSDGKQSQDGDQGLQTIWRSINKQ